MLISLFMENGSVFVERQDSNTMFRVVTNEWQVELHMPHELAATLLSHHKAAAQTRHSYVKPHVQPENNNSTRLSGTER